MTDQTHVTVLLVEDDPGDALLTREALEGRTRTRLELVTDGAEAIAYLRREAPHQDAVRPDLILLDLNLPRRDGREVLAELKADPDLAPIPVVILTTSHAHEDIVRSYDLHANAYVAKPVDFDDFAAAVREIDDFYIGLVQRPSLSTSPN
ncbi:response regulator [Pseudonocardia benzenivorans]|uniref:Response regulator receiver protein n=2 Tax=Pseudonocardia TaxID=1847 RepID=F4CK39_PSEUX|nr:response regulator [Pseudonocardia dioxanivorans]AEA28145.1 response regulator receiver protein [Pseudonocardia dioxanivorans CB1190]GJF06161.1 two-component system response regulator [Pseudonocardia sp. D17]